jgi:diaminopimelate epimerase
MKEIYFIKMAGTGNDYIFLDCLDGNDPELTPDDIKKLSNRKTGIGSDGLVKILSSDKGIAKMKMWNSDGSPSRMCGNALRCIGLYVSKKFGESSFLLESDAGLHKTKIMKRLGDFEAMVEVEIGKPYLQANQIPFLPEKAGVNIPSDASCISIPLSMEDIPLREKKGIYPLHATLVSVGNPHCVIFVEDVSHFPVQELGSYLETHPSFPERTNVEFVSRKSDGTFFQRTFERGAGETDACGSGACAVLVASVLEKKGPSKNTIELLGGILEVEWDRSWDTIFLRGSAREIFRGSVHKNSL